MKKYAPNLILFSLLCLAPLSFAGPPVAEVKPVTDDLFGAKVTDPYRYFENLSDPKVQSWFKGQADYSRSILDSLGGRAEMQADMEKYVNGVPAVVGDLRRQPGDIYFYLKTPAGKNVANLYMRHGLTGEEKLLVDAEHLSGPNGEPAAISFYELSFDDRYVAYGLSRGGSERATLRVLDVQTGAELPEQIDRTDFGAVAWRPDNKSFFYNREQKLGPDASPLGKEEKSLIWLHILGTPVDSDVPIFGFGLNPKVKFSPTDAPYVTIYPGSDHVVAGIEHGVLVEQTLYTAPISAITSAAVPWSKICDTDAGVSDTFARGDDLYVLSHDDAPRYKILRTSLSHPDLANAAVVLPQQKSVIRGFDCAADALYVRALDGAVDHIIRIPYGGTPSEIPLPYEGGHSVGWTDPRLPGAVLHLNAWTKASRYALYDPAADKVAMTDLQPAGPYDNLDDITSEEFRVPSYDGVPVALSIIHKKNLTLDGANHTIVMAYGGYGITLDSAFDLDRLAWLERGGVYAVAHVRGGGEFGEPWHLGAKQLTKPNVWRDTIACCEYLIKQKYTSPHTLAITGGSNGGITIGRAITERPDLFAAAQIRAGVMNPLRMEFEPNGPPNIPEYGDITTEEGFEDLYAMDAYQHVKDGVQYPAVLEYTGINDPRVASWEPAKMTARLQAATSSRKPVLLTVDYKGGHGVGMAKSQRIQLDADTFSFFLWQFEDPRFIPHATLHSDIEYENVNGESIKLDAAVPDDDGLHPIAILVHGGGWSSGEKAHEFPVLFSALSASHFTWFSIDYRMGPDHQWPACYDDMNAAIRWVKAHAAEYKGDPNRIALIGYSAGGELVTLVAARADDSTRVRAVVGFAPPTDMEADTARRNGLSTSLKKLLGVTTVDDHVHQLLRDMSAIDFVTPRMPPTLLIQGNADKSVMYPQTQAFAEKLRILTVPYQFITIEGGPHDILKWEAIDPDYRAKVVAWLQAYLAK